MVVNICSFSAVLVPPDCGFEGLNGAIFSASGGCAAFEMPLRAECPAARVSDTQRNATLVFEGTVAKVEALQHPEYAETLEVHRVWKGYVPIVALGGSFERHSPRGLSADMQHRVVARSRAPFDSKRRARLDRREPIAARSTLETASNIGVRRGSSAETRSGSRPHAAPTMSAMFAMRTMSRLDMLIERRGADICDTSRGDRWIVAECLTIRDRCQSETGAIARNRLPRRPGP